MTARETTGNEARLASQRPREGELSAEVESIVPEGCMALRESMDGITTTRLPALVPPVSATGMR